MAVIIASRAMGVVSGTGDVGRFWDMAVLSSW
jgi:hypothetical protein